MVFIVLVSVELMRQYEPLTEDQATNHERNRIMFVNDNVDTTTVIKEGLTRYGYEVETFVDPNLALENFKVGTYDLLLLDVLMVLSSTIR